MIACLYLIGIMLMLAVGARAPEFTLPDQDGRDVSLTSLLNHGPLVLFFYPADFTPGCTKEVCMIRDLHAEMVASGLTVAGVSPQRAASHRGFRAKHGLPFTLLSDPDKAVIGMYEVLGPLGIGVRRATYLIDPSRHIRDVVLADFRIGRHEDFVRRAMALSSGHSHV
jgi:peroxiredoxin Q/BCP